MLRPSTRASVIERTWPGARVGGSQGTVFTEPPSWSTAISKRGRPPLAAARRSAAAVARSRADEPKLKRWMITPPISPRLARPSSDAEGIVPLIETTSFCPTSCKSVGAATSVRAAPGEAASASRETTSRRPRRRSIPRS